MPKSRHTGAIFSPSSRRATNLSRSSMRLHSFPGTFALPQKAQLCNPCLRNELSPFSQEGHSLCGVISGCVRTADIPDHYIYAGVGTTLALGPSMATGERRGEAPALDENDLT